MKNILFIALFTFLLSTSIGAQTLSEIVTINRTLNLGTARYNGLSGAFNSLGGDLTAISENPAGSAVFLNSYGSATISHKGGVTNGSYFGTTTRAEETNLNFNQIGGVLILKNSEVETKGINKLALAISYNKNNDFRDEVLLSGEAQNSIADYFVGQANGTSVSKFNTGITGNDNIDYFNQLNGLGFQSLQGFLGFETNLIEPIDNTANASSFMSKISGNTLQEIEIITSGSNSKTTFNGAIQVNEKYYIGANVNLHSTNYEKTTLYTESNLNAANEIFEANFDNTLRTRGTGISLSIGGIAKIGKNARASLSYQTPTWSVLQDEVRQKIVSFQSSGTAIAIDPQESILFDEYRLRIPSIISAGGSYIFGKNGLISAQYSRQDFSKIEYRNPSDSNFFDLLNKDIDSSFRAINTFKIGAEYRVQNWRLRGGLNTSSSPYKNRGGETNGFSLGTGYNWGKWILDVGYSHLKSEEIESLFDTVDFNNSGSLSKKEDSVSITIGVNF